MLGEKDSDEKWPVHFSVIQKCSALGSTNLLKENQYKEKLNIKSPTSFFDVN